MAITPKKPQLVRDYLPRFKSTVASWHAMSILLTFAIVAFAVFGPQHITEPIVFWSALAAIVLLAIGAQTMLLVSASQPISVLTNALAKRTGEQTSAPLANPNDTRYEKSGLSALLRAIYELPSSEPSEQTEPTADLDFSKILDSTSMGIVVLGETGEIIYANKHAPVKDETSGTKTLELLFDVDQSIDEWVAECRERAVRSEKTWRRIANRLVGEEGRKIYDISASYEKGGAAEVVIALIERTPDYIESDDELDFIAFAAHELRGPITVIRGYLDSLRDELADRFQGDEAMLVERLIVSANRLSGYVNNILNAAKFDRRHLKVHLKEDSLAAIYDTIRDDMELRASAQHRLLSVTLPADLPTIAADRSSLSEVIGNLIDNAIKYSNEGSSVIVSAQPVANHVELSVSDNGIGMPGNVINNLFHKFYRSHRSRETVAGTGIGLYICKAIVESHGGTISVRSVEGEGSVFTVSLPTYVSVAEKLKSGDNSSEDIINTSEGWIKNHGAFRG